MTALVTRWQSNGLIISFGEHLSRSCLHQPSLILSKQEMSSILGKWWLRKTEIDSGATSSRLKERLVKAIANQGTRLIFSTCAHVKTKHSINNTST